MRRWESEGRTLELVHEPLEAQRCDAIVNDAGPYLSGNGPRSRRLHRAAGPELAVACRGVRPEPDGVRCSVGRAVITAAGGLPCRRVIHAVGPQRRGSPNEDALNLAAALRAALELASGEGLESLALPPLGCAPDRVPSFEAAPILLRGLMEHLWGETSLRALRLCLESPAELAVFASTLQRLAS